jgi:hypothetical protein
MSLSEVRPGAEWFAVDKDTDEEIAMIDEAIRALSIEQAEAEGLRAVLEQEAVEVGVDEKVLALFEARLAAISKEIQRVASEIEREIKEFEGRVGGLDREISELLKTIEGLKEIGTTSASKIITGKESEKAEKIRARGKAEETAKAARGKKGTVDRAVGRVERTGRKVKETREALKAMREKMFFLRRANLPMEVFSGLVSKDKIKTAVDAAMKDLPAFVEGLSEEDRRRFEGLRNIGSPVEISEARKKVSGLGLSEDEKASVLKEINEKEQKLVQAEVEKRQKAFIEEKKMSQLVAEAVASGELDFKKVAEKIAESFKREDFKDPSIDKRLACLPEEAVDLLIDRLFGEEPFFGSEIRSKFLLFHPRLWKKRKEWLEKKVKEMEGKSPREKAEMSLELEKEINKAEGFYLLDIPNMIRRCGGGIKGGEDFIKTLREAKKLAMVYGEYQTAKAEEEKLIRKVEGIRDRSFLADLPTGFERSAAHSTDELARVKKEISMLRQLVEAPGARAVSDKVDRLSDIVSSTASEKAQDFWKFSAIIEDGILPRYLLGPTRDKTVANSEIRPFLFRLESLIQTEARFETQDRIDQIFLDFKREMEELEAEGAEKINTEVSRMATGDMEFLEELVKLRKEIQSALQKPKGILEVFGKKVTVRSFDKKSGKITESAQKISAEAAEALLRDLREFVSRKVHQIEVAILENEQRVTGDYNAKAQRRFAEVSRQIADETRRYPNVSFKNPTLQESRGFYGSSVTRAELQRDDYFRLHEFREYNKAKDQAKILRDRLKEIQKQF